MRWGVVTFPGSNDDHDAIHAIGLVPGETVEPLWHKDEDLRGVDCVVLPGGFSYGDYLRCGAMARFSPLMARVVEFAHNGGLVLAICNGFQIACEAGLLPGALVRNRSLQFICADTCLRVERTDTPFTNQCTTGEILSIPIKHGAGCYVAEAETLRALEEDRRIVLRYVDASGRATPESNPNGSANHIAAITNAAGNVLGMMPHPEHATEPLLGSEDGLKLFGSVIQAHRSAPARRSTTPAPGH